jgi:GDPmannose 4,6-dehydratase
MAKSALVIGVTGQDGAYLAALLAAKGYVVHGTSRDAELARCEGLHALGIRDKVTLHSMSPVDLRSILHTVRRVEPDEIYNLSGQSSVGLSFSQPTETMESIVLATLNILEVLRLMGNGARFYNAGSCESFGDTAGIAADESLPFRPKSPYGIAKSAAVALVANYRESYGLFASSGILFNHESPLRPERFVTRKIVAAAVRIADGSNERLTLGNLAIRRDWGWAPEYVEAMWAMLQQDEPGDFVIASGAAYSLEEFVERSFANVGLDWRDHVDFDPNLCRPSDIAFSRGDASKAARVLGWRSAVGFAEVIERMIHGERKGPAAVSPGR